MDGEFYAEGVLNVYSFLGEIVVYLRRANQKLEAENGNFKYKSAAPCRASQSVGFCFRH